MISIINLIFCPIHLPLINPVWSGCTRFGSDDSIHFAMALVATLQSTLGSLKCIWQIFFIRSIKSPQCADKCSKKKNFDSDFPSPCFDVPKASNFTSGGVQNRDTKNRRLGTIVTSISPTFSYFLINNALLYHFLANWLAYNKKMTEKSVFRKAWSPELTSQSFPVSCF